jgi:hypothetical protein
MDEALVALEESLTREKAVHQLQSDAWSQTAATLRLNAFHKQIAALRAATRRLQADIVEITQNGEVEAFDSDLYQLASEENIRLKEELGRLKEELELTKKEAMQLIQKLSVKEQETGLLEEKLESMRQHTLVKVLLSQQDEMVGEYSDKLADLDARLKEMTAEAANHKVKSLQLQADMLTMQENYDAQIADLSTKLVEMLTQSAGRK